jgi:hypothetical protein
LDGIAQYLSPHPAKRLVPPEGHAEKSVTKVFGSVRQQRLSVRLHSGGERL